MNLSLPKMGQQMTLPSGELFGSYHPMQVFKIDGNEWTCIATKIKDGMTYDKIKNLTTNEMKVVERTKFINLLIKKGYKLQ